MNFKLKIIHLFFICSIIFAQDVNFNRVVNDVKIIGVHHSSESKLSQILKVKPGTRITEAQLVDDINSLYLSGFFKKVHAYTVEERKEMHLIYSVEENDIIQNIIVTGNISNDYTLPLTSLYHQPQKILNLKEIDTDKDTINGFFQTNGFELNIVESITYDKHTRTLYIKLLEKNINKITFTGLNKIDPDILKREMTSIEGESFNVSKLRFDRQRLLQLNYFSSISAPKIHLLNQDAVHIDFNIQHKKTNILNLGLEQEDDKIVSFLQTRINHTLIQSDSLTTKLQMEPQGKKYTIRSYSIRYKQPWLFNRYPITFSIGRWAEFRQEFLTSDLNRTLLFDIERNGWDTSLGFSLFSLDRDFFIRYKDEFVSPKESINSFSSYKVNSLSLELNFKALDNFQNPHKGYYANLSYEKGGNLKFINLGGLNFSRWRSNIALFLPLKQHLTVGIRNLSGEFNPENNQVDTFEEEGFIMGGAGSLRGYKEIDHPFIGNKQMLFNTELRYNLNKVIQAVIFYDIGKTFQNKINFDFENYETGFGAGLRFFTPVGPVRIDIARSNHTIIHFGLGQLF